MAEEKTGTASAAVEEKVLSVREEMQAALAAYEQNQIGKSDQDSAPEAETKDLKAEDAKADTSAPIKTNAIVDKKADAPEPTSAIKNESVGDKKAESPPPPEFLGASKIDWNRLPASIKKELSERYGEFKNQEQELAQVRARYGEIEQVLGPHAQRLAAEAGSLGRGLSVLFDWERLFRERPAEAIFIVARDRGIDLAKLAAHQSSNRQPPNDPYLDKLAQLEQRFENQQSEQRYRAARMQIDSLSANAEKFPFFNDLRADMSSLMQAGLATSLEEAYEQAAWRNPTIRQHLITAQREAITQAEINEAARAKRANGSLKGGTAAPGTDVAISPNLSAREELHERARQAGLI